MAGPIEKNFFAASLVTQVQLPPSRVIFGIETVAPFVSLNPGFLFDNIEFKGRGKIIFRIGCY